MAKKTENTKAVDFKIDPAVEALVKKSKTMDYKADEDFDTHQESDQDNRRPYLQPAVKPGGMLSTQLNVEIHSRNAFALIIGRKRTKNRNYIPSLFAYSNLTRGIVQSVYKDDPWADWSLIRLEEVIDQASAELDAEHALLTERITSLAKEGIRVERMTNVKPAQIDLQLMSPYALRAAMLAVKFDNIIRDAFPLRNMGVIDIAEWQMIVSKLMRTLTNPHMLATRFKARNVTRKMVIEEAKSPEVLNTIMLAGRVPEDILLAKRLPKFAPRVERYQTIETMAIVNPSLTAEGKQ